MATEARQRMAALVREWEGSDESRRAFAARHGLTVSQFDYWKRQVRRDGTRHRAVGFAHVQVIDAPREPRNGIEVMLSTGDRLVIHEGVSVDLVRTVVTALRSSC